MPYRSALFLFLAASLFLFGISSCKSTKVGGTGTAEPIRMVELMKRMESSAIQYNNLKASLDIDLNSPDKSIGAGGEIRIDHQKKVWVKVKKSILEVARAQMTPDSMSLINRLDNTYCHKSFSWFNQLFGVNVDFNSLENILMGKLPAYTATTWNAGSDPNYYVLTRVEDNISYLYKINPTNYALSQLTLTDQRNGQTATIVYSDYEQIGGQWLAMERNITLVQNGETTEVSIGFSKVEKDIQLSFPFSVSSSYDPCP